MPRFARLWLLLGLMMCCAAENPAVNSNCSAEMTNCSAQLPTISMAHAYSVASSSEVSGRVDMKIMVVTFNAGGAPSLTLSTNFTSTVKEAAEKQEAEAVIFGIQEATLLPDQVRALFQGWEGWSLGFASQAVQHLHDEQAIHLIILQNSKARSDEPKMQLEVVGRMNGARCIQKGLRWSSRGLTGVVVRLRSEIQSRYILVSSAHLPGADMLAGSMGPVELRNECFTAAIEEVVRKGLDQIDDQIVDEITQDSQTPDCSFADSESWWRRQLCESFFLKMWNNFSRALQRHRLKRERRLSSGINPHNSSALESRGPTPKLSGVLILGDFNYRAIPRNDSQGNILEDELGPHLKTLDLENRLGWTHSSSSAMIREGVVSSPGPTFPPTCKMARGRDISCASDGSKNWANVQPACDFAANRTKKASVNNTTVWPGRCYGPLLHCILNGGVGRAVAVGLGLFSAGPYFLGFGIPLLYPPHPSGGMSYSGRDSEVLEQIQSADTGVKGTDDLQTQRAERHRAGTQRHRVSSTRARGAEFGPSAIYGGLWDSPSRSDKVEKWRIQQWKLIEESKSEGCCFADSTPRGWCDRILHGSVEEELTITCTHYASLEVPDARWSDHNPVFGSYHLSL